MHAGGGASGIKPTSRRLCISLLDANDLALFLIDPDYEQSPEM